VLSQNPALARRLPSGLKATLLTPPPCLKVNSWPVWASHTFTVLSAEPLAKRLPSGLKATHQIASVCPLNENRSWPTWSSQSFSDFPATLAKPLPSGLKATPKPASLRERSSRLVWASHTFTVLSAEALARRLPSGLKTTV